MFITRLNKLGDPHFADKAWWLHISGTRFDGWLFAYRPFEPKIRVKVENLLASFLDAIMDMSQHTGIYGERKGGNGEKKFKNRMLLRCFKTDKTELRPLSAQDKFGASSEIVHWKVLQYQIIRSKSGGEKVRFWLFLLFSFLVWRRRFSWHRSVLCGLLPITAKSMGNKIRLSRRLGGEVAWYTHRREELIAISQCTSFLKKTEVKNEYKVQTFKTFARLSTILLDDQKLFLEDLKTWRHYSGLTDFSPIATHVWNPEQNG